MKKILGIVGSLRVGSYNKSILKAVEALLPSDVTMEYADIGALPLYNGDLEANFPASVTHFKNQIKAADAIIFATPEYDRSVPGVLKNAIDWASRPYGDSAWNGKPVLVMGASGGSIGTAVAQSHLKQILLYLNMKVVGQPELYINAVAEKLDKDGVLIDEKTKEHLKHGIDVLLA